MVGFAFAVWEDAAQAGATRKRVFLLMDVSAGKRVVCGTREEEDYDTNDVYVLLRKIFGFRK